MWIMIVISLLMGDVQGSSVSEVRFATKAACDKATDKVVAESRRLFTNLGYKNDRISAFCVYDNKK